MPSHSNLNHLEVFPWNKNFETGHPEIDAQHKKLAELLNKLASALTHNEQTLVNDAFDELADYAHYHFEEEEAIWVEHFDEDSWLSSHQLSHASFLPTVLELKDKNTGKPLQDIIEDIVKFLIRWLAFHIIDDDKRLAIVVEAKNEGHSIEEAKNIADKKMNGSIRVLIETILSMYDNLSSRTLKLMRERNARIEAEKELKAANKKLEELSITDQLTSLFNRRHFENIFEQELRRAKRDSSAITYILFDIDFFKKLNDTYGHHYGDQALKKIGAKLKEVCRRPTDYAFRVGGEEFAVISVGNQTDNTNQFAEIIRQTILDLKIENDPSNVHEYLTISVGAVSKIPTQENDIYDLMKEADLLLYQAKNKGRNCVVSDDR